jgi:hypothetical protein
MATPDLWDTNAARRGGRPRLINRFQRRYASPGVSLLPRSMRARRAWVAAVHTRMPSKRGLGRGRLPLPCGAPTIWNPALPDRGAFQ